MWRCRNKYEENVIRAKKVSIITVILFMKHLASYDTRTLGYPNILPPQFLFVSNNITHGCSSVCQAFTFWTGVGSKNVIICRWLDFIYTHTRTHVDVLKLHIILTHFFFVGWWYLKKKKNIEKLQRKSTLLRVSYWWHTIIISDVIFLRIW